MHAAVVVSVIVAVASSVAVWFMEASFSGNVGKVPRMSLRIAQRADGSGNKPISFDPGREGREGRYPPVVTDVSKPIV